MDDATTGQFPPAGQARNADPQHPVEGVGGSTETGPPPSPVTPSFRIGDSTLDMRARIEERYAIGWTRYMDDGIADDHRAMGAVADHVTWMIVNGRGDECSDAVCCAIGVGDRLPIAFAKDAARRDALVPIPDRGSVGK